MSRNFPQRIAWWWPLAFAVFALSACAAIALAAGTAHADGGIPSTAGESQSEKSPTKSVAATVQTDPAPAENPDGPLATRSVRPSDGARILSIVRHSEPVAKKVEQSHDDSSAAVDATAPEPSNPPASLGTHRFSQLDHKPETVPTAQPAKPSAVTTTRLPTTETTNVVSLPNGAVTSAAGVDPNQKAAQFGRQLVGLASDVGIIGASLVNNVAAHTAAAIGPQLFWGVPYTAATVIADTAGNVSKVLSGTPLDAASVGPFKVNYGVLDVLSFFTPSKVPAGANDPSIAVTAAHPLPVILVNGTVETQSLNWSVGAPVLANAGYKVYTFNYGNITPYPNYPIQSTADIRQSAIELSDEVDRVLAETGAPKVILVGHSQGGGILPVYYLNELGGADKVSQLIGLAPSNHGTDFNGLIGLQMLPILGPLLFAAADLIGPALGQQVVTSPFQQVVYGNGDTRPGVQYTTIASTNDEVVTPYTQQALHGPDVTNIVLQDLYPGLPAGHVGVAFSAQAWASVLEALAANAQASPLQAPELTAA